MPYIAIFRLHFFLDKKNEAKKFKPTRLGNFKAPTLKAIAGTLNFPPARQDGEG